MITTIVLLVLIGIFNVIDYQQTIYAVQFYGVVVEANPIVRFLIEQDCMAIIKLILFPIVLVVMGVIVYLDKRLIWYVYALFVLYGGLIIHNFIMLSRMGLL